MKNLRAIAVLATMLLVTGSLLAQVARVTKEELPPPVLNTLEKQAPGSTFGGASKQPQKDGTVKYAINLQQGEQRIRLLISPEGKLFERSENAKFAELPAPVK